MQLDPESIAAAARRMTIERDPAILRAAGGAVNAGELGIAPRRPARSKPRPGTFDEATSLNPDGAPMAPVLNKAAEPIRAQSPQDTPEPSGGDIPLPEPSLASAGANANDNVGVVDGAGQETIGRVVLPDVSRPERPAPRAGQMDNVDQAFGATQAREFGEVFIEIDHVPRGKVMGQIIRILKAAARAPIPVGSGFEEALPLGVLGIPLESGRRYRIVAIELPDSVPNPKRNPITGNYA